MAVTLILSPIGRKNDHKQKRINFVSGKLENAAYRELEQSFFDRIIAPKVKALQTYLEKMAPKKQLKNKKDEKKNAIEKQLRLAGIFIDANEFSFIKTIVMIVAVVAVTLVALVLRLKALYTLLIILVGTIIGAVGPTFYLKSRVTSHQEGIRKQLPDAMDMIGVCIEAGLSFDSSLLKISEKLSGPFIDELLIVHREIQMGVSRREALHHLCDSSEIEELKTFASALAQAEQLGIPINNVMKVQSAQLRITRSQQAQEKGRKATIKMLVPMLLFIFPVIFIIVLGPTVIQVLDIF